MSLTSWPFLRMYPLLQRVLAGLLCIAAFPGVLRGDVFITYSGQTISPGGTGYIDVFVSSNAPATAPDLIDSFSVRFQITPLSGSVVDGLQFLDPQSDAQLAMPNYLFAGDSLFSPGPTGAVSTTLNTNDTFIAGDGTISGNGRALDLSVAPFLLFRLDLAAANAVAGDKFNISVVNDASTSFLDTAAAELVIDSSSFAPLEITAVPEPTAFTALSVAAVFAIRRFRRKQK